MTDGLIAGLALLWLGVFGVALYRAKPEQPAPAPELDQDEIERRLTGKPTPKHRATPAPARIRVARMARSNRWSK